MNKAPWPDAQGNPICEGDTLDDGGIVRFFPQLTTLDSQWRVETEGNPIPVPLIDILRSTPAAVLTPPRATSRVDLRVPKHVKDDWKKRALASGMNLTEWLIGVVG